MVWKYGSIIFNEQKQIIKAIVIFSDQQEYVTKQMKVGHPNCTNENDENMNVIDKTTMKQIMDQFLSNLMELYDHKYKKIVMDMKSLEIYYQRDFMFFIFRIWI